MSGEGWIRTRGTVFSDGSSESCYFNAELRAWACTWNNRQGGKGHIEFGLADEPVTFTSEADLLDYLASKRKSDTAYTALVREREKNKALREKVLNMGGTLGDEA